MMYVFPLLVIIFSYGSIYYEIFQKSQVKNSGEKDVDIDEDIIQKENYSIS